MKKRLLATLLAGTMIMSLAACGSPKSSAGSENNATPSSAQEGQSSQAVQSNIDLKFWNPFTGDDGKYMSKIVDNFNKEYDGKIKVSIQTMASDEYYKKIPVVFSSGTGIPDVIIVHVDRIPLFVKKGMLETMDDDIQKMGLSKDDFIAKTWDAGTQVDGKRYTVPLDTHPWLLFYNNKILKQLGYSESDIKDLSGDKFVEMCKKAKSAGYIGIGLYWPGINSQFYAFLKQFGGSYVDVNAPGKAIFNSDAGVKAAEFIKTLQTDGLTNQIGSDQETLFKQGKSLFCSTGIWASQGFAQISGLDWGETFSPVVGEKGAVWANSHNLAIMKQPKEDPARREACDTFIKYLSDHSIDWATGGQVPARLNAVQSDEFKKLPWAFAADHLDWFEYMPSVVTSSDMDGAVGQYLQEYYKGTIPTAKQALDQAAKLAEQKAAQTLAN